MVSLIFLNLIEIIIVIALLEVQGEIYLPRRGFAGMKTHKNTTISKQLPHIRQNALVQDLHAVICDT